MPSPVPPSGDPAPPATDPADPAATDLADQADPPGVTELADVSEPGTATSETVAEVADPEVVPAKPELQPAKAEVGPAKAETDPADPGSGLAEAATEPAAPAQIDLTRPAAGSRHAHVEHIEGLLASVQELLASAQRLGAQLEQEVALALYRDDDTMAPHAATLEVENLQLKAALEDRAVIEQAKGMIMARQGGTAQEAHGVLTNQARREHRSVRDVAAGVIAEGCRAADLSTPPRGRPARSGPAHLVGLRATWFREPSARTPST